MYVFLNEKDYQKAKDQIETLSKRKTFLIIFIFLLCLSVPAFTLAIIQMKAKQYIIQYFHYIYTCTGGTLAPVDLLPTNNSK